MAMKSSFEFIPGDSLMVFMRVSKSIPSIIGRASEFMGDIHNFLSIVALSDQQLLLNGDEPIICSKWFNGVGEMLVA